MGVIRPAQIDSKQQVRMNLDIRLISMKLGMNLIYYMWLGVYKYIYLIQSIHMSIDRHTWALQT